MSKKFSSLSLVLCIFFLLTSTNIYADTLPESAEFLPSSGEFSPTPDDDGIQARASCTPTYHFVVKLEKSFFFNSPSSFATSKAYQDCGDGLKTNNISLVYAKAKIYKNGAFQGSSEDTTQNGSYAGARVKNADTTTSGLSAYGEHKFKQTGYMEHNFNTFDN